jgi:hypothetical protein
MASVGGLSLQVDFEKDPLWFVANIYPASPGGIGAPKWGIRSRTPLQLVGLEGLDKNQALCAPVRPMRLISPSSRKLWAGLQKAARYGSPVRSTAQIMRRLHDGLFRQLAALHGIQRRVRGLDRLIDRRSCPAFPARMRLDPAAPPAREFRKNQAQKFAPIPRVVITQVDFSIGPSLWNWRIAAHGLVAINIRLLTADVVSAQPSGLTSRRKS